MHISQRVFTGRKSSSSLHRGDFTPEGCQPVDIYLFIDPDATGVINNLKLLRLGLGGGGNPLNCNPAVCNAFDIHRRYAIKAFYFTKISFSYLIFLFKSISISISLPLFCRFSRHVSDNYFLVKKPKQDIGKSLFVSVFVRYLDYRHLIFSYVVFIIYILHSHVNRPNIW